VCWWQIRSQITGMDTVEHTANILGRPIILQVTNSKGECRLSHETTGTLNRLSAVYRRMVVDNERVDKVQKLIIIFDQTRERSSWIEYRMIRLLEACAQERTPCCSFCGLFQAEGSMSCRLRSARTVFLCDSYRLRAASVSVTMGPTRSEQSHVFHRVTTDVAPATGTPD